MKIGLVGLGFQEVPSDVKAETLLSWSALEKDSFQASAEGGVPGCGRVGPQK